MRPASIFDTVEVKLPCPGGEFVLFRDLMNKGDMATNLRTARRLPSGCKLEMKSVKIEVHHWSGDNMLPLFQLLGRVRVGVNHKTLLDIPLREILYDPVKTSFTFTNTDDIEGCIKIDSAAWLNPTNTIEWKEVTEVTDEQLILSGPLARLNPLLRRSRTVTRPVSRPLSGSHLVTVHLQGELTGREKS